MIPPSERERESCLFPGAQQLRPGISSKNPIEPAGAAQASKGGPTKDKRKRRESAEEGGSTALEGQRRET